jgi:hypothetical protein
MTREMERVLDGLAPAQVHPRPEMALHRCLCRAWLPPVEKNG